MTDKLSLTYELAQIDLKNRKFWDELTPEERKSFSTYIMMKYAANVDGSADFQEWYLRAANERVNQNFFDINRHPQLQWLCISSVSPGMGKQRHYWLKVKKKDGNNNKVIKFLTKSFPNLKEDEIDLMAKINDLKDIKLLAKEMGMSDEEIKRELG